MKRVTKLSMLALASTSMMFGSLMPIGPVPESGAGLGSVQTLLTVTSAASSTTESGCVGFTGGTTTTGSTACPAGFVGGDEQAINNTYTTASLGLTDFANLQLIFNSSEPAGNSIIVSALALTLWSPAGAPLATYTTENPYPIADTLTGVGNAGWGFVLDGPQAAAANAVLDANPGGVVIGAAVNVGDATGGLETISLRLATGPVPPSEIPEPSTYALAGISLIGLAMWNRRKRS